MHNIKLTLAYDGTDFHGWQIQPGKPTIQGALTDVLHKLTQEERITVHGAGRTDAGVHAMGQVAHFRTHSELTSAQFAHGFNALLPPAIRVRCAEEVGPDFHARWQAQAKTYSYRIFRGSVVPPWEWRYVLHYPYPLEEPAMADAARLFEGEHDFTSFAARSGDESKESRSDSEGAKPPSAIRRIHRSELLRLGEGGFNPPSLGVTGLGISSARAVEGVEPAGELIYRVRGRSFLRYMVRKIVGTLLDVGRGKLTPEDIPRLFALRDRSRSGPTVPACGLCLESVEYAEPW